MIDFKQIAITNTSKRKPGLNVYFELQHIRKIIRNSLNTPYNNFVCNKNDLNFEILNERNEKKNIGKKNSV